MNMLIKITPKLCFLCSFVLFLTFKLDAQSISGKVSSPKGTAVPGVYIELQNVTDSSVAAWGKTDSTGRYRLEKMKAGNYMMVFNQDDFEQKTYKIVLADSQDLTLDAVFDREVSLRLNVGVIGKKDAVLQKNDTVEYSSSNYKVNKDATTENLITKMPGITSENGTIKAQGEEIKKVTVDGQDFFGDDAAAALKNLPAEVVDKIQVFDRQSDQSRFSGFDDGNSQKTLNIVTKAGRNNGQFGKVYGGYGTNDRWTAGGNINVFKGKQRFSFIGLSNNINQQNFSSQDILGLTGSTGQGGGQGGPGRGGPGGGRGGPMGGGGSNNFLVGQQNGINTTNSFGFNYSTFGGTKLKLTASYFYNNSINNTASFLNRTYFLSGGANQLYSQGDTGKAKNFNHRLNARLEYMFDSSNSLIYTPSISFQKNNNNSTFLGMTNSQEFESLNRSFSKTSAENNGYNINNSLLFRHRFKKPGNTVSLNINSTISRSTGNTLLTSSNIYYEPVFTSDNFRQNTDNTSNSFTLSPSLSYTMALGKKSSFELNYNPSLNKSKSYKYTTRFDSTSNEYSIVDSLLSNTFDNVNTTQKAGVTYRYKFNKLSFNIGVNAQHVVLSREQTFPQESFNSRPFDNILPNAMATYQYSKTKNLRLNYRTNTNLPSISQLQNVVNNSNPLILSTGNTELRQEFSHNIFGRYSATNVEKGRNFFVFANVSATNNYIGNNNILAARDTTISNGINEVELRQGSQINLPVNLNGYRNFRAFMTYGIPVKKLKTVVNMNLGQSLLRSPALINGRTNYSNTSNTNAGIVLASNINEQIDFNVNYSANYNVVTNSIQSSSNNSYIIHYLNGKFNWLPTKHIVLNTEISNSTYTGLAASFNQSIWLWNAGVGYKFMKDQRAELRLSVFDLLKQNRSIARTVTENYIEDKTTQILTRFYMLTFTYNVRNFKAKSAATESPVSPAKK
jgi:hypothetical protein